MSRTGKLQDSITEHGDCLGIVDGEANKSISCRSKSAAVKENMLKVLLCIEAFTRGAETKSFFVAGPVSSK